MLTAAQVSEINQREQAIATGPWKSGGMIGDPGEPLRHFVECGGRPICFSGPFAVDYGGGEQAFAFIAAARQDVPALLADRAELRERLAQAEAALSGLGVFIPDIGACFRPKDCGFIHGEFRHVPVCEAARRALEPVVGSLVVERRGAVKKRRKT